MKKILLCLVLLFFGLSNAYAIKIGLEAFSKDATVIGFNVGDGASGTTPLDAWVPITDQYDPQGVLFSGVLPEFPDGFKGDPFFNPDDDIPDATINGTLSGANFFPVNNPIVASFDSLQNKVGMFFGFSEDANPTFQIAAFLDSELRGAQTFGGPGEILDGGTIPSIFGGIFVEEGFNRIEFSDISNAGFKVDDFTFETGKPIPEPATFLLLGAGLVGLAGFGRKKFFRK